MSEINEICERFVREFNIMGNKIARELLPDLSIESATPKMKGVIKQKLLEYIEETLHKADIVSKHPEIDWSMCLDVNVVSNGNKVNGYGSEDVPVVWFLFDGVMKINSVELNRLRDIENRETEIDPDQDKLYTIEQFNDDGYSQGIQLVVSKTRPEALRVYIDMIQLCHPDKPVHQRGNEFKIDDVNGEFIVRPITIVQDRKIIVE